MRTFACVVVVACLGFSGIATAMGGGGGAAGGGGGGAGGGGGGAGGGGGGAGTGISGADTNWRENQDRRTSLKTHYHRRVSPELSIKQMPTQ
jgi:hypothetical protein